MSRIVRFTATITPEDGWYVARCIEIEVASQGRTIDEALANLREALELYFEDEPAPEVQPEPIFAPVEIESVVVPLEEYRALKALEQREAELYWEVHEARYPSRPSDDIPEDKVYDSMDDLLADLNASE